MLNQLENLTERVGGSNELVDRWLQVRKHLLVAYYNLVGLKPGKESFMRLNEKALDDFCQSLVDYLSSGHFSIYERIIGEMEGDTPLLAATRLYPQLEANTQQMMTTTIPASKTPSITITILNFSRRCRISASRWRRVSRWKIN